MGNRGGTSEASKFVGYVRDRFPGTFNHHFANMTASEIRNYYMDIAEATLAYLYENLPEGEIVSKETFHNALVSIKEMNKRRAR